MIAAAWYAERLHAPAVEVWRFLQWDNLELMIPSGFIERVDYDERRSIVGATRSVWLADGRRIRERLEALPEHANDYAYDYRIIDTADFPLAEYRGSVRLTHAGEHACSLRFACQFTPLGVTVAEWETAYVEMQKQQIAYIKSQVE